MRNIIIMPKEFHNFLVLLECNKIYIENKQTRQEIDEYISIVKKLGRLVVLTSVSKHVMMISCIITMASMVFARNGAPNITPYACIISMAASLNYMCKYTKLAETAKQMHLFFPRITDILTNHTNSITK